MLDLTTIWTEFPVLETKRFTLRAPTAEDAGAFFRIMRDPQVTRYFGQLPMTEPAEADKRIQSFRTAFEERSGIRWAITERASGALIGSGGFWRLVAEHDRAEIGYELAPEWWGQGVMTEALGAALGYGFATIGLHSVEANIHPENSGSRRVLEKLGFTQEGYFRENYYDVVEQRFTDTATFSLLKRAWLERHGE